MGGPPENVPPGHEDPSELPRQDRPEPPSEPEAENSTIQPEIDDVHQNVPTKKPTDVPSEISLGDSDTNEAASQYVPQNNESGSNDHLKLAAIVLISVAGVIFVASL